MVDVREVNEHNYSKCNKVLLPVTVRFFMGGLNRFV